MTKNKSSGNVYSLKRAVIGLCETTSLNPCSRQVLLTGSSEAIPIFITQIMSNQETNTYTLTFNTYSNGVLSPISTTDTFDGYTCDGFIIGLSKVVLSGNPTFTASTSYANQIEVSVNLKTNNEGNLEGTFSINSTTASGNDYTIVNSTTTNNAVYYFLASNGCIVPTGTSSTGLLNGWYELAIEVSPVLYINNAECQIMPVFLWISPMQFVDNNPYQSQFSLPRYTYNLYNGTNYQSTADIMKQYLIANK